MSINSINDKEISGFVSRILLDDEIPLDKNTFRESLAKMRRKGVLEAKKKLRERMKEAETKGDKEKVKRLMKEYSLINSEVGNG